MAKSRTITTNLARVFDASPLLVYVISGLSGAEADADAGEAPSATNPETDVSQARIVYANDAFLNWTGLDFLTLKETPLFYSVEPIGEPDQDRIKGLCPAPSSVDHCAPFSFSIFQEAGVGQTAASSSLRWRRAWGLPIVMPAEQPNSLLVVAESTDWTSPAGNSQGPDLDGESFLPAQIHQALARLRSQSGMTYTLESLIGTSDVARSIKRKTLAATKSPDVDVLIVGATGTGREYLARTIFEARKTAEDARLLPLHCAIADQKLVQANIRELAAPGSREQDDCLLLLEVDRLSAVGQAELMGFLELPNFSLRTIATASTSLSDLGGESFRSDLADYLSTMVIELSPLANRISDIPLIAQLFLEQVNLKRVQQLSEFSDEANQMLLEYGWPENLDELKRCVISSAGVAKGVVIEAGDLPEHIRLAVRAGHVVESPVEEIDLTKYLERIERELIERALIKTKGNKSKASKLLGISRPRLLRRIDSLGIVPFMRESPPDELVDESVFLETDES